MIVVSRPRKERFVMAPEGGTIQSTCVPDVKVLFPPDTLNTSTKVVLQVQQNEDSLLHPEEQTHVSPIVSLEPPTTISKFVTVTVPCPWLSNSQDKTGRNIRLLAWLTKSPTRSVADNTDHEWKDITANTGFTVMDDYVTFETSEFTKYWVVQTNSPETLTKRISTIQQTISATPFSVRFFIYGRLKSPRTAELRLFAVTDEHAKEEFSESVQGFQELSRSSYHHLHSGQQVHINVVGNLVPVSSQNLKLHFQPFQVNRLKVVTEAMTSDTTLSCRVTFIGSLRKDENDDIGNLCTLAVSLTEDMLGPPKIAYPEETGTFIFHTTSSKSTQLWQRTAPHCKHNHQCQLHWADKQTEHCNDRQTDPWVDQRNDQLTDEPTYEGDDKYADGYRITSFQLKRETTSESMAVFQSSSYHVTDKLTILRPTFGESDEQST
jgi:hypothetical protein